MQSSEDYNTSVHVYIKRLCGVNNNTREKERKHCVVWRGSCGATTSGWRGFSTASNVWTGLDGHARIMEMEGSVVITQHLTYTFLQI